MILRIATRGSKLALWQARHVEARLRALDPSLHVELLILKTEGDRIQDRPLAEVGGKGLFVKEIEEALLDGRADVAVHSMKDLPADLAPGLRVAAVPEREDPRDALLVRPGLVAHAISGVADLPRGARVGTSSLRRVCLLRVARPDLQIVPLRGNVDTRLRKLGEGDLDAIVLAVAGLRRLGLDAHITAALGPAASALASPGSSPPASGGGSVAGVTIDTSSGEWLPAIGQGALAIECRSDATDVLARLAQLDHAPTRATTTAERALLAGLEGNCRTPIAGFARIVDGDALQLDGFVGAPDGSRTLRGRETSPITDAERLGRRLADRLLADGAADLLGA